MATLEPLPAPFAGDRIAAVSNYDSLERRAESFFRFIAEREPDFRNPVTGAGQLLRSQRHAPARQIIHGREPDRLLEFRRRLYAWAVSGGSIYSLGRADGHPSQQASASGLYGGCLERDQRSSRNQSDAAPGGLTSVFAKSPPLNSSGSPRITANA